MLRQASWAKYRAEPGGRIGSRSNQVIMIDTGDFKKLEMATAFLDSAGVLEKRVYKQGG